MKKLTILALLILFSCIPAFSLFAGATPSPEPVGASSADTAPVENPIVGVQIEGLMHTSRTLVMKSIEPHIGSAYTAEKDAKIRRELDDLKRFVYVNLETIPAESGKGEILSVYVVELPVVGKVSVEGNTVFYREAIENMMSQKRGRVLDRNQLFADAEAISARYRTKGYPDVQVKVEVAAENRESNTTDLVVRINEGLKTTVKEINFSGNKVVSSATLRRKIATSAVGFLKYGRFEQHKLDEDKKRIESYYHDRGYLDARLVNIDQQTSLEDGVRYLSLNYEISEGELWKLGDITIEGNTLYPTEQLIGSFESRAGEPIMKTRLERDFAYVSNTYLDEGYIFNTIDWQPTRDEQRHVISYHGVISERPQATVKSIVFKGLTKTKEYVLKREMEQLEGQMFSRKKLMQSLQNLYNTGFVKSAVPDIRPLMDGSYQVVILITVEEQRTLSLSGGLGIAALSEFPLQLKFSATDKNIFGSGNTFGAGIELSGAEQMLSLNYGQSWISDKRISFSSSFSVARNMQTGILQDREGAIFGDQDYLDGIAAPDPYNSYEEYQKALARHDGIADKYLMDYRLWKLSFQNSIGYTIITDVGRLTFTTGLDNTVKHVNYDETKYRPFQTAVRDNNHRWRFKNILWASVLWDYRDFRYNPRKGVAARQTLSYGGGILGGISHYLMSKTDLGFYYPIAKIPRHDLDRSTFDIVLSYETSFSMIMPQYFKSGGKWQWGTQLSQEERLMTDGMNVGRGWGSVQDLELIWNNMVTLSMPIAEHIIWGDFFFNATGYVTRLENIKKLNASNFLFSFGSGVRLVIPSFPFGFYFSKGFSYDAAGNFHWKRGAIFGNNANPNSGIDFSITVTTTI